MEEVIKQIAIAQSWQVKSVAAVSGGDINQAFAVETASDTFFVKLNSAKRFPRMFEIEASGLKALSDSYALKVPQVIAFGVVGDQQYLILEWLKITQATANTWEAFGTALAQLHKTKHESFGWGDDTYLGSIKLTNKWNNSWPDFYSSQRIMPLTKLLKDAGTLTSKEVLQAEKFCKRLADEIPLEPTALLHGDLWSGNASPVLIDGNITTAIYDPSVYYGHREIDIALTRLFGGFPASFYESYHATYPLVEGWQQRLPIFQLSHLLLHAVLFGGGYVSRVKEIMKIQA